VSENQLSYSRIWLVGLSGSGKSTVGERLAQQFKASFIDTDAQISSKENKTISDIFKLKGETYFRSMEKQVCNELITSNDSDLTIIATGGGFPCFENNIERMCSDGLVVYLNCSPSKAAKRLNQTNNRPLLHGQMMAEQLEGQLILRKEFYHKAHVEVNANNNPSEVIAEILGILNALKKDGSFDFEAPAIQSFLETFDKKKDTRTLALSMYYAIRDGFLYDPYHLDISEEGLKASKVASKKRAWCVEKALLLAACARSFKIPARLGFAIVTNHIGTEKLTHYLGRKEIVFHGFAVVFIQGKWVKCTPAFDKRVCSLSKVEPLEWDGEHDSLFQEFSNGFQFMEYLHNYGEFDEIPFELMKKEMKVYYPHLFLNKYDSKEFSFRY